MAEQIQCNKVRKEYHAKVVGSFPNEVTVDAALSVNHSNRASFVDPKSGKAATKSGNDATESVFQLMVLKTSRIERPAAGCEANGATPRRYIVTGYYPMGDPNMLGVCDVGN